MAPFIRYNIYLSPEQLAALHRIYDEEGTRVSEQIRRALDTWLIKKGQLAEKTRCRSSRSRRRLAAWGGASDDRRHLRAQEHGADRRG